MRYINKATGHAIDVSSGISGENWEPVETPNAVPKRQTKKANKEDDE